MAVRAFLVLTVLAANAAQAETYRAPRTVFGQPDLQGVWDNDTITRLQRPKGFAALIATPEEAKAARDKARGRFDRVVAPVSPDAPPPPPNEVEDDDRFEAPGDLIRIDGQLRSSQITDPADGRLPYRPEAKAAADQALKNEEVYDDPEGRPFDERCLLGGGGGVAAPITNRTHLKIVQTRDAVVLFGEQNHEARIIPVGPGARRPPAAIRTWMGESVGHWEGDVLVVETRQLSPQDGWRWNSGDWIKLSPAVRFVERFRRTSRGEIRYSFTVDDPATYTQVWRGEAVFRTTTVPMFEFACHEGNYALTNILAGGRAAEREAASARAAP